MIPISRTEINSTFFLWWTRTLDDCRGPPLVCLASSICIWIISFALVIWWPYLMYTVVGETLPARQSGRWKRTQTQLVLGQKQFETMQLLFKMGKKLQCKEYNKVQLKSCSGRIGRHHDGVSRRVTPSNQPS